MVELAVVKSACLVFVCTAAAQYGKAVWFDWVWEYWSWVEESGCAVGCQLLEYLVPLGWRCVVDEIALVALLVTGSVIVAWYTVVSCCGCVTGIVCI